jgi:uncharacterized sulfatase
VARAYIDRPAEELYDVTKDPDELNNIAGDKSMRPVVSGLRERLEAWMRQQGDRGVATEMEAKERQISGSE